MYRHGGDIYSKENVKDFSANMNFYGMPEEVIKAAKRGVELSGSYPDPQQRKLKQAIAEHEGVPENFVVCGNGAAELIFSVVLAKRPKKAVITAPAFYEYEKALSIVSSEVVKYKLKEETGFTIQKEFIDLITKEVDMVFLCNPNNPTGVLTEKSFLQAVLRQCERSKALLIIDECFLELTIKPQQYAMKEALHHSENVLLIKAFTKLYSMAGLRLGYALSNDASLNNRMEQMVQPWNVSIPAQMAGIAALKEKEYVIESRKAIDEEKKYMISELKELGYPVIGSEANYIFFQGSRTLYTDLLVKGFLIRDCSNYEGLTGGWYRIAVRGREDNKALLKALGWMKE